jgi:hypothetical protein
MVSHLFFYQLTLIAFVWLCVMLQWVWPSDSAACPTIPKPLPPLPKRTREPTPFAGLTTLGRSEEALACYDHALTLDPHNAQVWYNKGAVLANSFQCYREALACFEEAQKFGEPLAVQAIELCRQRLDG